MAAKRPWRKKRTPVTLDELGGRKDGGLAILDKDEKFIHMTPPSVATALRYFLARVHLHENVGLPERVALTAALRGEGVTYISRSLASVIAYDTDQSVIVVDMNWRTPRDEPESQPGLADLVERGAEIDDAIIQTTNPRLSLIRSGAVPFARRSAIASSPQLDEAIGELSKRFDHLLFDLPPVLASSEAMNLSQLADSFVFVVRHGVTPESQVAAALEEMRGGEPLGVVLNRFSSRIPRRLRGLVGT